MQILTKIRKLNNCNTGSDFQIAIQKAIIKKKKLWTKIPKTNNCNCNAQIAIIKGNYNQRNGCPQHCTCAGTGPWGESETTPVHTPWPTRWPTIQLQ